MAIGRVLTDEERYELEVQKTNAILNARDQIIPNPTTKKKLPPPSRRPGYRAAKAKAKAAEAIPTLTQPVQVVHNDKVTEAVVWKDAMVALIQSWGVRSSVDLDRILPIADRVVELYGEKYGY